VETKGAAVKALEDKVAVITSGRTGIGLTTAKRFQLVGDEVANTALFWLAVPLPASPEWN
jgi:hypothetical protein